MDRSKRAYWEVRAARRAAPPLPPPARPSTQDIAGFEACAQALATSLGGRALEALILGVTRDVVAMRWPVGSAPVAMDWSGAMIHRVWPGGDLPRRAAPIIADWRQMPLAAASRDLALGDGCFASLNSFAECAAVTAEVWRVLRPGGYFVQRCFSRPEAAEPVEPLFDDLHAGRIPDFEQFRWRLAMALHPAGEAVVAEEVWQAWRERVADPGALCTKLGWAESATAAIEAWNAPGVRVPLPTLEELREMTAERFEMLECRVPRYPLGERFPTLVLRARR